MATINSREDQDGITIGWQAIVRRKGYPSQTRTFRAKRDAEAWARGIESEMDRGVWRDRSEAENTTLKGRTPLLRNALIDTWQRSHRRKNPRVRAGTSKHGWRGLSRLGSWRRSAGKTWRLRSRPWKAKVRVQTTSACTWRSSRICSMWPAVNMEVSTITGHKTLQMLKRHTHLRAEDLAKRMG